MNVDRLPLPGNYCLRIGGGNPKKTAFDDTRNIAKTFGYSPNPAEILAGVDIPTIGNYSNYDYTFTPEDVRNSVLDLDVWMVVRKVGAATNFKVYLWHLGGECQRYKQYRSDCS
jgi:hypothetical protein